MLAGAKIRFLVNKCAKKGKKNIFRALTMTFFCVNDTMCVKNHYICTRIKR